MAEQIGYFINANEKLSYLALLCNSTVKIAL